MRSYSSGRHWRFGFTERNDRPRRRAGGLAEEDENDDGDEGDEESLEVEQDVLEQYQRSRQPGVTLRRFAERGGERDERRVHRQQKPEHREVGGELGDGEN